MNFLAHSILSCDNEDLMIGNLLTDLIKKRDESFYSESIRAGIDLHRKIDTYTDNHPLVKKSLLLIYPTQGKYSPVVLDILWDYFLSRNWDKFGGQDLQQWSNKVYALLIENYDQVQEKVSTRFKSLIKHNFLLSCSTPEYLQKTFTHLDKRTKFSSNFSEASELVTKYEKSLNDNFLQLFPEMIEYVEANCNC